MCALAHLVYAHAVGISYLYIFPKEARLHKIESGRMKTQVKKIILWNFIY